MPLCQYPIISLASPNVPNLFPGVPNLFFCVSCCFLCKHGIADISHHFLGIATIPYHVPKLPSTSHYSPLIQHYQTSPMRPNILPTDSCPHLPLFILPPPPQDWIFWVWQLLSNNKTKQKLAFYVNINVSSISLPCYSPWDFYHYTHFEHWNV